MALLSLAPESFGYVSAPTTAGSSAKAFVPKASSTTSTKQSKTSRYDLGLGKNKPVVNPKIKNEQQQPATIQLSVQESVKYWAVPEAVNEYPSPLLKAAEKSTTEQPGRKPRTKMPVTYNRMSEDVLTITKESDGTATILQTAPAQLDVNSIWVEMMIHSEQMKLAQV